MWILKMESGHSIVSEMGQLYYEVMFGRLKKKSTYATEFIKVNHGIRQRFEKINNSFVLFYYFLK